MSPLVLALLVDTFSATGYLRMRADLFNDLDLNTGPTPSGQTYFPTAASNPLDKTLSAADMRLRVDPLVQLGLGIRLRGRIDVLDNVALGSTPDVPSEQAPLSGAATVQVPPHDSVRIKRAWGEITLPFGVLAVGRMGALVSWGTGMVVDSGDCLDCDFGDAGDRVMLTTFLGDHLILLAYDWSAVGPGVERFGQTIDLDRADDVRTVAFAVAKWNEPMGVRRLLGAGRAVINYSLIASYRWQDKDAPGWYRTPQQTQFQPSDFVQRDLSAWAVDAWFLYAQGPWRVEAEGAALWGRVGNASPIPGAEFTRPVDQQTLGAVGRVSWNQGRWFAGVDAGYASGDPAPGFGVRTGVAAQPGDIDGGQLRPPNDFSINNFVFAPDYRIDLILWRRLIGRITDAFYTRPQLRYRPWQKLELEADLVYSRAIYAGSTPSLTETPLGVELDVQARWLVDAGFEARLGYGVLDPLAGLRVGGRDPQPAQTLHLLLAWLF
jgi:uncharacterized protein (TIGR04551 family)